MSVTHVTRGRWAAVLFVVVLGAVATACDVLDDDDGDRVSIPFTTETVDFIRSSDPQTVAFFDQEEWSRFFYSISTVDCIDDLIDCAPVFDFERFILAGVFWGTHSGCLERVETITEVRWNGQVTEIEIGPLPNLGPCEALVYPSQLILFDRLSSRVVFTGQLPGTG